MKMGKRIIALACALALVCSFALAGCGSSSSTSASATTEATGNTTWTAEDGTTYTFNLTTPGAITVGSDLDYPPFEYLDGDVPQGFGVELMQGLTEIMGLDCTYLDPQKFDTLITTVASNSKMDVGCSSFTITDERKQEIDFTDPYFDSNQAVVVRADSAYAEYSDLVGTVVAAQSGTTGESWALENIEGITMTSFDATTDALNALVAGKVEAVVIDLPVAVEQTSSSFSGCKIITEVPTGEQYGIVVSKDNPGLTEALNAALAQFKASGDYETLYNTYFQY